ncbi:MAG: D-arabinose 5-phosphate isomerase [Proteobacteria bacterium SG_bin7]|nr:MAG: D-arabinose 5-phosphate isomerase [Proteobacteria bacterium SG_bin7]
MLVATRNSIISEAIRVLEIESREISALCERVDDSFVKAVEMISVCKGKVIVSGIGKSGQVGRKISSTLSSTGTPSVYLHPAETSHGDLGVISSGDLVLAISYGGESTELNDLLAFVTRKEIPLIGMTGNKNSSLGKASDVILNIHVSSEACPMGLAPTSSTTATLAMGDALAMSVLKVRGFKESDFAELHPGGKLGRKLLTRVKDLMHTGDDVALVGADLPLREILPVMARGVRGVVGIIDRKGFLIGAVTDGDIRRRLLKSNPLDDVVRNVMSSDPKTVGQDELAEKALTQMEKLSLQCLFVTDSAKDGVKPVGIIHFQDILKAKII